MVSAKFSHLLSPGLALPVLLAACDDGSNCSDEQKIAIALTVTTPSVVEITKVTAELNEEEECGFFSDRERVYTCWEQGAGGTYKVRIYDRNGELHSEDVEVPWDGCHAERVDVQIDLTRI